MTRADRFRTLTDGGDLGHSIKAQSVRGGTFAMASEGVDFLLRFGSIAILARLLVPEHFGLLAMVTAITTIAERFKDLGLSSATVQREEITHEQISTLFWVNAGVGVAIMFVVAAVAGPIASFYGDPRLFPITLAIATSFLFSGASIQHQALLRRNMRFGHLAAIQVGSSFLSILIAVTMAVMGFGYWALVVREVSRTVLMALGSWICLPWIPAAPSRQAGVESMLRFGGNLTAFYILKFVSISVGQILIGKLFGAASLGIYRQGFQLVLAPIQQLTGPLTAVGDAALSRLQNDPERYRRYYHKFLTLTSIATMPLVAFLVVFAEDVVLVFLGESWIEAAPIFRVLALAVLFNPAVVTANTVATTNGHPRRLFWLGVFESVILVAFFAGGIPWGATGIASAHVWTFYLVAIPWLYWCFKDTPITLELFFVTIARPLTASLLMAGALVLLRKAGFVESALANLCLGTPVGAGVYLGCWLLLPGGKSLLVTLIADLGWTPRWRSVRQRSLDAALVVKDPVAGMKS